MQIDLSRNTITGFMVAHSRALGPALALTMIRSLALTPLPWLFSVIIDRHLATRNVNGILSASAIFLGLLLLHYALSVWGGYAIGRALASLSRGLRALIFRKFQFLSFGYLDQSHSGRLLSKYAFDTQKIQGTIEGALNNMLPNLTRSLLMVIFLVVFNWQLSLILMAMLPVFYLLRSYFFKRFRHQHRVTRIAQEQLTGTANELISALRMVRSFGEEKQATNHIDKPSYSASAQQQELISIQAVFNTVVTVMNQFFSLVVVAGGAILIMNDRLTIGMLFTFLAALPIITQPLQIFATFAQQYFLGQEAYHSVKELLDSTYVEEWKSKRELPRLKGAIRFEKLDFNYPSSSESVIRNFDLDIQAGESIAFVGPSGSGKSTLANLVIGLYKPTGGRILIDGNPQETINMRWLRKQVAVVMQESLMLSGSVMENLRFANENATDREIHEACRMANAEEFILRLPFGYDTALGENAVHLSGGERQRISIARAFLRKPRILILDEATSALDYESERLIQEAMDRIRKGRTTITIAHRLSTIRGVDRIVVLRDGEIVEQGSYDQLKARGDYFSYLLSTQNGEGFEKDTAPEKSQPA